ncbi:LOW QUALITY PROTEIN: hypothetical protein Cgig2_029878 [Carnegiea gigantea]|uniref:Zinc knuckle CX2CX4HX4C domain-containing protein n=1 Tax=Carnegiea gigantea TaxID=171969 RepID=A0A9Q1QC26_9CARY|nr:LOW QUALITY PROTEIN: hypothetical protein Cgig2_029878 [Carnegiea gigantea]
MSFAKVLVANIGELVSFNDSTMVGIDKALCFMVDIDITKPLRRGINVMIAGKSIWIRFKYVKLPNFCYGCGKLAHILKGCNTIEAEEGDPRLQYEKKLFSTFQKTKANPPARTKLVVDNPAFENKTSKATSSSSNDSPTDMIAEPEVTMEVGTEGFKCKQGDLPKVADCKIRIIEKCPEVSPPSIDPAENMWFTEPSYKEVIERTWSSTMRNDAVENLVAKLDTCSAALSKWNIKTFGHVGRKISKLEARLQHNKDALSRRKMLSDIREWRKKEQILW